MIIAQIHLEKYWDANSDKRIESYWSIFYIVFIYIAQEICIMELTLLNINTMAFTIVIPITMILRNRHKLWWGLLVITPFISMIMDAYLGRYQFINWGATALQLILTTVLCLALIHWEDRLAYYTEYAIAIYCNGLIHILRLVIEHQLRWSFVVTILLGNFFIVLAETSRRHYELKQEEEMAKLHYESERDDLTGLLNYRAFDRNMRKLSNEENKPILMAILDIDHFKNVNDTYGHLNGNVVLRTFSRKLESEIHYNFDPNCAVYRFGGEEFTIVIEDQSYAKVVELLNSINDYFSTHPVKTSDGQKITFSFSGGLTMHLKGEDLEQTLARADTLVYQAKDAGRKRILYK